MFLFKKLTTLEKNLINLYEEKVEAFSVIDNLFGEYVDEKTFGEYTIKDPETFKILMNMETSNESLVNQFMNGTIYDSIKNYTKTKNKDTPIPKTLKDFVTFFTFFWYSTLPCFDVKGITSEENGQGATYF